MKCDHEICHISIILTLIPLCPNTSTQVLGYIQMCARSYASYIWQETLVLQNAYRAAQLVLQQVSSAQISPNGARQNW